MVENMSAPATHLHPHHPHDHAAHEQSLPETRFSRFLQRATVIGNIGWGVLQVVAGRSEGVGAALVHGVHDMGDGAAYGLQMAALRRRNTLSDAKMHRLRKAAFLLISGTSVLAAAKSGNDLVSGHDTAPNALSSYAVGASLVCNSLIAGGWYYDVRRRGLEQTVQARDIIEHVKTDVSLALLATGTAIAQKYNAQADQFVSLLGGVWVGWKFRPTERNLHKHDHSGIISAVMGIFRKKPTLSNDERWRQWAGKYHPDFFDVQSQQVAAPPKAERQPRRWLRRAAAVGAAMLTLAGATLVPNGRSQSGTEAAGVAPAVAVPVFTPEAQPAERAQSHEPTEVPALTECVLPERGDSISGMAAQRAKRVTNGVARNSLINAVTIIAGFESRATYSDIETIQPGICVQMPTPRTILAIHQATLNPGQHPGISEGVTSINNHSTLASALNDPSLVSGRLQARIAQVQSV